MNLITKAIAWMVEVMGYRSNIEVVTIQAVRKGVFGRRMNCRTARQEARKLNTQHDHTPQACWSELILAVRNGTFLTQCYAVSLSYDYYEAMDTQIEFDHDTAIEEYGAVSSLLKAMGLSAAFVLDQAHEDALEDALDMEPLTVD